MLAEAIKFGVSLGSILALAGFAWLLKLGGDMRIRDARHARAIAQEHLAQIERKIIDLQAIQETLSHLVRECSGDGRPDCPILKTLEVLPLR